MKELQTLDINELKNISQTILREAQKKGASQAEVNITANKGFTVGAHGGSVETVEYHQDKSVEICVYFGKRSGSASISDLRIESIRTAIDAACHIAKFTDDDPASGLADKEDLAFDYPTLETYYPWNISVDDAIKLACECENIALSTDKRIMSAEEVRVATIASEMVYANSLGFLGSFPITHHDISCVLVAKQNDEMQRDYSYSVAVDPHNLYPIEFLAKEAVEKTVRRLGAKKLPTLKCPVMFIAEEARSLLGHFAAAISGGSIYRKSSFLIDHLQQKVFPDYISLQEKPFLPKALGSAPFDEEGVATRENIFVMDGVLNSYALGVYSARKLGLHTTGNSGGLHNLTINTSEKNLPQLIKEMHRGLIVTELMGHGVNLVTGHYSRGAGGYWVENGEIQYPVHEITIAGNLKDIYAKIVAVGNDVDTRGNIRTGSVLIAEMTVAGD